ncbi:MAG: hypothetical protein NTY47_02760, partial [Candidatus Omnitrophica bacterium]|nr:hypothetical protein [Candidatus Omnitrophota bacterium]
MSRIKYARVLALMVLSSVLVFIPVGIIRAQSPVLPATVFEQPKYAAPLSAEELNKGVKVDRERLSLDLKGIDINELL